MLRLFIIVFLILAILLAYSPLVSREVSQLWEHVQPGVIVVMDNIYAAVRDFVAGPDTNEGIQDNAPSVDFDKVITMERGGAID